MGIKQIAGIVAAVAIIGFVVMLVIGLLPDWIDQIWDQITSLFDVF